MDTPHGAIPAFMDDTRQSVEPTLGDCRSHISTTSGSNAAIEFFNKPLCAAPESSGAEHILHSFTIAVDAAFMLEGHGISSGLPISDEPTAATATAATASAATRLLARGATIVGRTEMDQCTLTANPDASVHGAATSVAKGNIRAALGLDVGGCLREHAAWLGVVGFTPTYGRISKYGIATLAPSCSQVAVLARNVDDAALVFSAVSGEDPADCATTASASWTEIDAIDSGIQGLRFAIPGDYLIDGLQQECHDAVVRALTWILSEGADAAGAHITMTKYATAAYTAIFNAEAAENLARYEGVRYGQGSADVLPFTLKRDASQLSADMHRRLILGAHVASADGGTRYCQAMKVRRKIALDFEKTFQKADILITPVTVRTANGADASGNTPRTAPGPSILTSAANLAGIPAITIPAGTDASGFPVGLQLLAKPMNETALFRAAVALQKGMSHW